MRQDRTRTRRNARSEQGAVMLVVMLILLTATAMAAVSLQSTQYELRAAGYGRAALQTQYVSEAIASSTIAWTDMAAMDQTFKKHLDGWSLPRPAPDVHLFGEPILTAANRRDATRTQWIQQQKLVPFVMPPLTRPGETGIKDVVGTFGPRSVYVPGNLEETNPTPPTDFVVDMYDCQRLPNTLATGSQINQGGNVARTFQMYCVVTARGRAYVPGAPIKKWTLQGVEYSVRRLTMSHDSRGTIVTPPMM